MNDARNEKNPLDKGASHRRRPRYSGTHPKRFDQRYKELDPAAYPEMQEHVRSQGRTPAGTHVPVLIEEVLAVLKPAEGEIVADCTLGFGGHAERFLERIGAAGRLVGLDLDGEQLERTGKRFGMSRGDEEDAAGSKRISLHHSHFAGLPKVLNQEQLDGCNVIFADLGVSSMQIDDPARGFSYKHDGPLDMRMDLRRPRTAADLLESMSVAELAKALQDLADEPDAERIAECIVRRRERNLITRTKQLVDVVFQAKQLSHRAWRQRPAEQRNQLHPAALTFQALRMLVNEETTGLEQFLRIVPHCLRPAGRVGVISFHSGEDRRVKHAFRDGLRAGVYSSISEEPIQATPAEIASNPRSRPAKFRWAIAH